MGMQLIIYSWLFFRFEYYINPLNSLRHALHCKVGIYSILPHLSHLKYTYYTAVLGHFCVSKIFTSKKIINTKLWPE